MKFVLLSVALLAFMVSCEQVADFSPIATNSTQQARLGSAHIISPDQVCRQGSGQSPIDIQTASTKPFRSIDPLYRYSPFPLSQIINTGENLRVNVSGENYITLNGTRFNLLQFHFHRDSEHGINSQKGAMEAHLVHQAADGRLAVVGVLIQTGFYNLSLDRLFNNSPRDEDTVNVNQPFYPGSLLPLNPHSYYTYCGSLTTTPFSEPVNWIVCAQPIRMSSGQLAKYAAIYPEPNARAFQPLNGRTVFYQRPFSL